MTFRGTLPKQVAMEPRAPRGAHHTQIRAMALRGAEDFFSGIPLDEGTVPGE